MIRKAAAAAAVLLAAPAALGQTVALDEAATIFGARPTVQYASLSPSGDKLAYISPFEENGEVVFVVDLKAASQPKVVLTNKEAKIDISYCDWATEDRLVCGAYGINDATGMLLGFSRLFAVDADGGNVDLLTAPLSSRSLGINQFGGSVLALDIEGKPNRILMTRDFVPEQTTGTRLASDAEGLGVEEVDIHNRRAVRVEQAVRDASRYIADENGRVRIMIRHPTDSSGRLGDRQVYHYRTTDSDRWQSLAESQLDSQTRDGFYPIAVDSARDVVFGFDSKGNYDALYAIALDGSGRREEVLSRDDADVDELIRIGRRNRVVGASYATEKREISYIDEELASLARGLGQALPGKPLVNIVDASQDEGKLLIIASGDTAPGMIYRYHKDKRQLEELLPVRAPLEGRTLGAMRPVTYPATDGTQIPAYLTLPPGQDEARGLPAIVLPHGGPSARDEWGFDWLVQFFASQGYAVLQPNYRGSAGYGSAWFGKNGFQAWETAIGDVNDAGRWLISQGVADADKLAIFGWSYGGYAALQSQVLDPALYKAVVAVAPVTDLALLRDESRGYTNYRLVDAFIGRGPHLTAGSPAENASAFRAPVLLFHGTLDQNVGVRQSRRMQDRLEKAGKQVAYVEFEDLAHSLDDGEARTRMLRDTARFLKQTLGE